jgi:hypothetical protein
LLTTRSIVGAAIRQLKCLTEQAVTEWTESKNWTESTETHEAERSALGVSEASGARRLATVPFWHVSSAASPQSLVAVWPNSLIVIWYGEELTP